MRYITTMHDGAWHGMEWDSMRHITTMHDKAWHGMERGKMRHIATMHDGMAQHGMAKDNMPHITTMHDGMTQHERLADRKDEDGRIDWSVMSEVVIDPSLTGFGNYMFSYFFQDFLIF
jgi:hypothetical protein